MPVQNATKPSQSIWVEPTFLDWTRENQSELKDAEIAIKYYRALSDVQAADISDDHKKIIHAYIKGYCVFADSQSKYRLDSLELESLTPQELIKLANHIYDYNQFNSVLERLENKIIENFSLNLQFKENKDKLRKLEYLIILNLLGAHIFFPPEVKGFVVSNKEFFEQLKFTSLVQEALANDNPYIAKKIYIMLNNAIKLFTKEIQQSSDTKDADIAEYLEQACVTLERLLFRLSWIDTRNKLPVTLNISSYWLVLIANSFYMLALGYHAYYHKTGYPESGHAQRTIRELLATISGITQRLIKINSKDIVEDAAQLSRLTFTDGDVLQRCSVKSPLQIVSLADKVELEHPAGYQNLVFGIKKSLEL